MKITNFYILILFTILFTGCRAVQPILILKPWDMFWMPVVYIGFCWIFAKILTKDTGNFWFWFVLNVILTPIIGLIIIISRLNSK